MEYNIRMNRAEDLKGGVTRVFGLCAFTGEEYECRVPTAGVLKFLAGEPAQRAFPDLNLDDREFLISGISPKGWSSRFGK